VKVLDEGEDLLADHAEHLLGLELAKARPAQVILPFSEDRLFYRLAKTISFLLFSRMDVIQPLDDQQKGDLLDHPKRIGNHAYKRC